MMEFPPLCRERIAVLSLSTWILCPVQTTLHLMHPTRLRQTLSLCRIPAIMLKRPRLLWQHPRRIIRALFLNLTLPLPLLKAHLTPTLRLSLRIPRSFRTFRQLTTRRCSKTSCPAMSSRSHPSMTLDAVMATLRYVMRTAPARCSSTAHVILNPAETSRRWRTAAACL